MIRRALLLILLLTLPHAAAAQAPLPTIEDGAALARDGHHEAALASFRRIAAANPRDHEARLWIARLHLWMGHPDQAEPVYRSVLLEDPASVDAMFGLGMTLVELGETDDAIEMLEQAETTVPQNAEVLAALSQAHTIAGHTMRGVLYAERALALDPIERHRLTLEQARAVHGHRVEITSFGEQYNTTDRDTGSVDGRVNLRVSDDLRIVGRVQHQRKFGFSEQRGGGGLEWRWTPRTSVFAHLLGGPSDNAVLPRLDINGEVAHTEGPATWVAGYRYFDFPSAQVSVVSPGVTWWPHDRVSILARYYLSITDFAARSELENGHSLALRTAVRIVPRVWANGGYTRGTDNFETLSPDRLGDFDADTVSGGVRVDLPSLTSVFGLYEHQWRPNSVVMKRLSVSLLQRF